MIYTSKKSGLGYFLLKKGIITKEQLLRAVEYQNANSGKRIGEILYEMNILGEDEVLEQLADYMNEKFVILHGCTYALEQQNLFDKALMLEYIFAPFDISGNVISVAVNDIKNHDLRERIEGIAKNYKVEYYLSLPSMIKEFIKESYSRKIQSLSFIQKREKFGEYLIRKGIVNSEQLEAVLQYQQKFTNMRIGEILCEMGIMGHEAAARELSEHLGRKYESLRGIMPRPDLKSFFDDNFMLKNSFVPFGKEGNTIKIAVNNIFDFELIDIIEARVERENLKAEFYISPKDNILEFIKKAM